MFTKILIANRGEIACRVIDSARRMGVATVAVYSDADRSAKHVAMADQAVRLGPPPVTESYLLGKRLVEAALSTGAQAIHPGYGFLSENPEFVEMVQAAGLAFIGPSASAIRAMGLKDAAKALMEEAGVPVVPGYHGDNQDDAFLAAKADEIGYPVLIKAVAGGGGKGMRRVDCASAFADALSAARGEGRASFNNGSVLIEKYVQNPRHIEIQVFGDNHGQAIHLFERDCSLQRRHQKVIEEAPAPGMTDAMRQAMGDAAVTAAKAIGYSGAGTIEFIVDGSDGLHPDRFWFMEMNTRLQVEHPVTEAITGVDLVEWQLRVAAGEPLPARQSDLSINGHAFEARIYAEDVPAGFLPATGQLAHLHFPDHARIDSGVRQGDGISPFYDPMIAKLTTHAPDRAAALGRLHAALHDTRIIGTTTNIAFLAALTRQADFAAGKVDTGLIERHLDALIAEPEPPFALHALAAIGARDWGDGFTLWEPMRQQVRLSSGDYWVSCLGNDRFHVTQDDQNLHITVLERAPRWRIEVAGSVQQAQVTRAGNTVQASLAGATLTAQILDPLDSGATKEADGNALVSPMPGLVKSVSAQAGERVTQGAALIIMEAMKMEHTLRAPFDGVVAEVLTRTGAQVESGVTLLRMEEP